MATKTYRIKIAREGHEFEAEGDKIFVLDMLKRYWPQAEREAIALSQSAASKEKSQKPTTSTGPKGKMLSVREFIQQLSLKKHTDITLAFSYYLEKYTGVSEFTPADINNCYYEAKLESSNTSQMIIQNVKRGRLMASKKHGEKGRNRYTVTASGEKFIESKLPRS